MQRGSAIWRRFASWLAATMLAPLPLLAVEPVPLDPADVEAAVVEQVRQAILALDADEFATRQKAADQLERLADDSRLAFYLAAQFQRVLQLPDTSVEVRSCLASLAQRLPPAPASAERPTAADIVPLLDSLQDDLSSHRDAARRRLQSMVDYTDLISPLWQELKRRAAEPALSTTLRRELEPLLDQARRAWALAEPQSVMLPAVSSDEIARLIALVKPAAANEDSLTRFRREQAVRDLQDLLARDDARPAAQQLLEAAIAASDDAGRTSELQEIADFARPSMAAEVWGNRMHLTVQYLIIGVPQLNRYDGNGRSTHFDRIDELTAHCVTGNSLVEGDYPVRVAIPHPEPGIDRMFYLTNLPTPRRRIAYEYLVKRDPALRLREITQRTVNDIVGTQRVLNETEVLLLAQLDPSIVSRFVGKYFESVPDRRLVTTSTELPGQSTVHGGICAVLSRIGTREAAPALEQLARSERLKPSYENPYQIAWIAALAIAQRDPWPGVDRWLAELIDNRTQLVVTGDKRPEVGASAAALLLDRQGVSIRAFGLDTAAEGVTERLRFVGYVFASERDRQEVKRWWQSQQAQQDVLFAPGAAGKASATPIRTGLPGAAASADPNGARPGR